MEENPVRYSHLSRRAQLFLKLGMLLVLPLLSLFLLEAFAYKWEKKQANGEYAWELVASRRIALDVYKSPGVGYTLMKPGKIYEYQGIPIEINSQGLRSPQISYQKPAGVYRILNLGDSIAMGWGVHMEETYGQLLSGLFVNQGNHSVEVINAGVPGWNLENELSYLQVEGLKYEPDLILLDITLPNDVYGQSALLEDRPRFIEFLRTRTYSWPFLTIQMRWIEARIQGRQRIDVIDPPQNTSAYFPIKPSDPHWSQFTQMVADIHDEAEKIGIPLVIALFPLEIQVIDSAVSTLPQQILREYFNQSGIHYIDLLPEYQTACATKPGGPCFWEDRYLFADVWMHPSALGHKIAAQQIYEVLQDLVK